MALAIAQGHAIFLDCSADRYFALSPYENDAVVRLLDGEDVDARSKRAIAAAIGIEAEPDTLRALMAGDLPPLAAKKPSEKRHAGWSIRLAAARRYFTAKVVLRVQGLQASLERLAGEGVIPIPEANARTKKAVERIAGAHRWLAGQITANDDCLLRSLALATHLRSARCPACLVIGVRADPFAAHCWVMSGNVLVEEEPDVIALFTPLLIVR